jgi:hypothetical protein
MTVCSSCTMHFLTIFVSGAHLQASLASHNQPHCICERLSKAFFDSSQKVAEGRLTLPPRAESFNFFVTQATSTLLICQAKPIL